MKVTIKGQTQQFTFITIVSETIVVGSTMGVNQKETKGVLYCYDKSRKVHKFLAEDIERID
jgi:hypothetical protein